jgi:hypothetical protein
VRLYTTDALVRIREQGEVLRRKESYQKALLITVFVIAEAWAVASILGV